MIITQHEEKAIHLLQNELLKPYPNITFVVGVLSGLLAGAEIKR